MQPASTAEVAAQRDRMLASQTFAASPRLRAFLQYIVDRTLAGEAGQLKEYAIGVDVFERDGQYDPRIDSIVRVEAGRLRAKVDEYYAGEGAADRVMVRIRRGSYVPLFEIRTESVPPPPAAVSAPQAASAPVRRFRWKPALAMVAVAAIPGVMAWRLSESAPVRPSTDIAVAVLPFAHYSEAGADAMLSARITDGVTSELARINTVDVVSQTSARQFADVRRPLPEIASLLNATTVIEGSIVTHGETVRVRTRIVDGRTDLKSNVRDFEGRRDDLDDLVRRIAESLSASFVVRQLR